MPIYLDVDRKLADPIESEPSERDWQPGNTACQKLFRCVEAFRDLKDLIDSAREAQNTTKRRRRLKLLVTPLYSLATCLDDLLNDCIGNPETRSKLSTDEVKAIVSMRDVVLQRVPFRRGGILACLRHKATAHVDDCLSPEEIRRFFNSVTSDQLGFWIDICVSLFCDLLKLSIYFWSCHSRYPDIIRMVMAEPFLVSFKIKDGELSELVDTHVIKQSPRTLIANLVIEIVENSRWLFGPNHPRIRAFSYEEKNTDWAQSLRNLGRESPLG